MADALRRVISRRFSRWHKAVAFAPALLLLVYLPGHMMLRCRMDGLLRSVCCCPQGIEESSGPVIRAQDCCGQEVAPTQRSEAEAASPPNRQLAPIAALAVVGTLVPLIAPATAHLDRAAQRYGPTREGLRIVLLKQAFLI